MKIIYDAGKALLRVVLDGEIDHHTAKEIREQIDFSIEKKQPELLVLDFCNVTFTDSSGIGLAMGRYRLMNMRGGKMIIINLSSAIKKIFSLAGLSKLGILEEEIK